MYLRSVPVSASFLLILGTLSGSAQQGVLSAAAAPFPHFESSPLHALVLAPSGRQLYALNTPDARVEVYDVSGSGTLSYRGSVYTGLEPVSMCLDPRHPDTLFVANNLSDSVSVVDIGNRVVKATINAGDEPQDVLVHAGKLYITTSRSFTNPQLIDPGAAIENAVVVASASAPYAISARIAIPAHKPRALALAKVSGAVRVFVIPQNSGNHTTMLDLENAQSVGLGNPTVPDAFDPPFSVNPSLLAPGFAGFPNTPFFTLKGWVMPNTARVVNDFEYPTQVPQLADKDVFSIDPATNALDAFATTGLSTTLLSVATNPLSGDLWVSSTQAKNRTRFEPEVKGQGFENRVTIVEPGGGVLKQILLAPPLTDVEHAQPVAVAFYAPVPAGGEPGGSPPFPFTAATGAPVTSGVVVLPSEPHTPRPAAYVAALGSASVIVLDAASGLRLAEISTGEIPSAVAVDSLHARLYVLARGDNKIYTYDIRRDHAQIGSAQPLAYDPEPAGIREGRIHLYDARASTGHGTGNFSCASCHVSGHADQLAWDLGDPEGGLGYFFPDLMTGSQSQGGSVVAGQNVEQTHPMKGPMTTQSLRGLTDANGTPLHWRGDRRFIQMFQGAFKGLLGGSGISDLEMQQYSNFLRGFSYPPNPYEPRDRVYTGAAAAGRTLFGLTPGQAGKDYTLFQSNLKCVTCHQANMVAQTDFSGSQRTVNFDLTVQFFNSATLRGVYEKEFRSLTGFGTSHDGSTDGTRGFLDIDDAFFGLDVFNLMTAADRDNLTAFVKRWDTGMSPLVGLQQLATSTSQASFDAMLNLAEAQAKLPTTVDLIGKARSLTGGSGFGLVYKLDTGSGQWKYLKDDGSLTDRATLTAQVLASQIEILLAAVPPGLGQRLGVDRDEDGRLDGQELAAGTSEASPDTDGDGYSDGLEATLGSNPLVFDANLPGDASAPVVQVVEARDVFATAATLRVQASEPATALVEVGLSAGNYTLGSFSDVELRRVHDVVVTGLPANTPVFWRVTVKDKNLNQSQSTGSFQTTGRLLHVDDITLVAVPNGGQYTITATVKVVDQDGAVVPNCPVRGVWAGDIGGQQFFPTATTNASGVATFALNPYTPGGPTTVSFSPGYVGSVTAGTFFVGTGGSTPSFFYQQPANVVNYKKLSLP